MTMLMMIVYNLRSSTMGRLISQIGLSGRMLLNQVRGSRRLTVIRCQMNLLSLLKIEMEILEMLLHHG